MFWFSPRILLTYYLMQVIEEGPWEGGGART